MRFLELSDPVHGAVKFLEVGRQFVQVIDQERNAGERWEDVVRGTRGGVLVLRDMSIRPRSLCKEATHL